MSKDNDKSSSIWQKMYYVMFFLVALVAIYLLYPKQGIFKYEFQKGMPWRHATLIAPFDFPILKPAEVMQAERDSVLNNFIPYFTVDTTMMILQMNNLEQRAGNLIDEHNAEIDSISREKYTRQIINIFAPFYNKGLLDNSIESYDMLDGKTHIQVVKNNIAQRLPVSDLESLRSAYVKVNEIIETQWADSVLVYQILRNINPERYLAANFFYDSHLNEQRTRELLSGLSTTRGVVQSGVRIISEGDIVNHNNYIIIESLRQAYERNRLYTGWSSPILIGQMILIISLFIGLVLYLQSFNKVIFWKKRNFSMIISLILVMFVIARLLYDNGQLNMYLLPICILPIIIRTFFGARMALFIHIIVVLIISFMVPNSFEYVFLQIIAGVVAVVSLNKLHRRGHLVITALFVLMAYALMFIGFELIKEASFYEIKWIRMVWFVGNAILLLIAYPLIYIIERIFGFISDVTLLELSDTNNPLLRKLAETAPGTFQHSMQIANLAEEAILKIGGNSMLVRAGALYHDIGKIKSSQYFIENLSEGQNPHEKLSNLKSVEKIVSHVTDGVKMAKKYKLPEPLIDFIRMHHGKGVVKFFYLKYKEENPDSDVREEDFMYPGPNPDSRETAVVMLADGVEAAARSLPVKNETTLTNIVNQIIDSKVQGHELDNAPITFRDIREIKAVFIEKLKNIYHLRIQYPTEKDKT